MVLAGEGNVQLLFGLIQDTGGVPPELLVPLFVTNAFALATAGVCFRWPGVGLWVFRVVFIGAGVFNIRLGIIRPQTYVEGFGELAVFSFYRSFIHGFFQDHAVIIIVLISIGQMLVGFLLFTRDWSQRLGMLGGIFFLVAITPLGIGSAFPAPLVMAFALYVLDRRLRAPVPPESPSST